MEVVARMHSPLLDQKRLEAAFQRTFWELYRRVMAEPWIPVRLFFINSLGQRSKHQWPVGTSKSARQGDLRRLSRLRRRVDAVPL
jgi:hypothetical protein